MFLVRWSHSRVFWLLAVAGLMAVLALDASRARAQRSDQSSAPAPQLSEVERGRRLQERDQFQQTAVKLADAGRLDEAVAAIERGLAIERTVLGSMHEDVVVSLGNLNQLHQARGDWAAARSALAEVLAIRQRQPDRKEWRIVDARRDLADLERRAAMSPEEGRRDRMGDSLRDRMKELRKKGTTRVHWIRD